MPHNGTDYIADFRQGAVYGKCVAANYQNAKKDMCAKEFMALKDCYLVRSDSLHGRLTSAKH